MAKWRYICFGLLVFLWGCSNTAPSRYSVKGVDLSHHQSLIDWPAVADSGIDFAFVKATEGETHVDTRFYQNWVEMRLEGVKRGAYHFFRPKGSALQQALHFTRTVDLRPGDLPPVLDVETLDNLPESVVLTKIRTWLELIEYHYHVKPIIYTNIRFFNRYLAGNFIDYPIWIARYRGWGEPKLAFEQDWHFWQYTDQGSIEGVKGPVDQNVFFGNEAELANLSVPEQPLPFEELPVTTVTSTEP